MGDIDVQAFLINLVRGQMETSRIDQLDVAEKAAITTSSLSRILAGKQQASIVLWQKIVDAVFSGDPKPQAEKPIERPKIPVAVEGKAKYPDQVRHVGSKMQGVADIVGAFRQREIDSMGEVT